MKIDYSIQDEFDDYTEMTEYVVYGFVDGNLFGVLGSAWTLPEAHSIGRDFNPNPNDARICLSK